MKCSKCGKENDKSALFCEYCGSTLQNDSETNKAIKTKRKFLIASIVFVIAIVCAGIYVAVKNSNEKVTVNKEQENATVKKSDDSEENKNLKSEDETVGVKKEIASCSQFLNDDTHLIIAMSAENDQIVSMRIKVILSLESLGLDGKSISEEEKKEIEAGIMKSLNLVEDTHTKTSLLCTDNNIEYSLVFDMKKSNKENLKVIGIETDKDYLLSEVVNSINDSNTTCNIETE